MKRVLIALSGGVDSSVSAYLLKKAGYDVLAITFNLCDDIIKDNYTKMIEDAKRVSDYLGIEHHVVDYKDDFKEKVIEPFIREYELGHTPNPCIFCNKNIKFKRFHDEMKNFDADFIATGHYVEKYEANGIHYLQKSTNIRKDQSYFLYNIKQEQLRDAIFPVGAMDKDKTRAIAKEAGIPVYNKKDSQEICFIANDDYKAFLNKYSENISKKGLIKDKNGKVLGEHDGIRNYTIGQRRGLNVALGQRAFVTKIDPVNNEIILGPEEDLFKKTAVIKDVNWISIDEIDEDKVYTAKVRYRSNDEKAKVKKNDDGTYTVTFEEPQRAITLSQSLVVYDGRTVVGGGVIVD